MFGTLRSPLQRFLVLALLFVPAACGGGGGGGPGSATPVIVTAAFVGGGATPQAGDSLLLAFSTDVTVIANTLVTDADVSLSGGATLGNVTAAPSQPSSNTLLVTLGTGVNFTPGTTTIALSAGNDSVANSRSALGNGGTAVVIGTSDGVAPTITNVTISGIDAAFNGTGAAGGTLQTPVNGWSIDLAYNDASGIATTQTAITANVTVTAATGPQVPGTDLRPLLTEVSADNTTASYRVPTTVSFPTGAVTLTCIVADSSGLSSTPATFSFTVKPFTNALQPFETSPNPQQVWFLDFSRDVESFTTTPNVGGVIVSEVAGANGRSDFEDLLRVLGLNSATPIANVSGTDDSNTVAIDRLQASILTELAAFYSGANVSFTLTQPAGSFGTSTSVPYASLGYSRIAIAGAPTQSGVLGLAIFDPSNTTQNDNTPLDFQGSRLGVFLFTLVEDGMQDNPISAFRLTFDPLAPSQGGTAIGDDAQDGDRLLGTLNDARTNDIDTALARTARFLSTIIAHECGHSVGLVVNGAMPAGLFGNDTTNFPGSSNGHIRNSTLFPSGSTNVMSPALSFSNAISPSTAFNSLNLAYLREQIFYNGN